MDGDLSLGRLRITNPDEEAVHSPSSPLSPSQRPPPSSHSTVTDFRPPNLSIPSLDGTGEGLGSALAFDPDSYKIRLSSDSSSQPQTRTQPLTSPAAVPNNTGSPLSHRSSMQFGHSVSQNVQRNAHAAAHGPPLRNHSVPDTSARVTGAMYNQLNDSPGSSVLPGSSYPYRDELMSNGGLARSGSTSARPLASSLPQREPSRTYRQPGSPLNGASSGGALPQRRISKRGRSTTSSSTATGGNDGAEQSFAGAAPVPRTAEEWRERGAAVGVQQGTDASGRPAAKLVKKGPKDFDFGRTLGEGSYSTVLAATDRQNMKEYAIKVLDKRHIIKEKKVKYVNIERDTLNRLTEHPGIVRLYYTFQDERSLYFVLDLASGGELLGVLKRMGSFNVECTRFYAAEILDSIAYMHTRGVIHRDLKPENVLLDQDMHVKITDFGTAKLLSDPRARDAAESSGNPTDGAETDRAVSFVGTAEYVSPELLRDKNACKASDLWAFGCIVYQLLAGRPPFKAANEYLTFQKILALDYTFPHGFPEQACDLVERLLVLEPANRLPMEHIKNHPFFDGVQWGRAIWRQKAPRLKAYVPPPSEPIRLNGPSKHLANKGAAAAMNNAAAAMNNNQAPSVPPQAPPPRRPQLHNVTDLPPPSQLDLEWAPVLTHNNERILKLGNLIVTAAPHGSSPTSKSGELSASTDKTKFSRFFTGSATKKRERLVLITSRARLVVAAAGGNEKKAKAEINLAAVGSTCKSCVDAKALTYWTLDTQDKHYLFEDPRATTSDPAGSKYSTQEWLDAVEQAREVAQAASTSRGVSHSGESPLTEFNTSTLSSPTDSIGGDSAMPLGAGAGPANSERHNLRHTLRRTDEDNGARGKRRFSKRHSKSGLAAVF